MTFDTNPQIQATGEFVPPGHFYSVVPSKEARQRYIESKDAIAFTTLPGIDLNREAQLQLLGILEPYFNECPFPDQKQISHRYHFLNPAYSFGDALTLNAMIRHFCPRRIIEIGSGYSSAAIMDTNQASYGKRIALTCIEPYPDLLHSLMTDDDRRCTTVINKSVQDVDFSMFAELEENDFLFIDSTHVAKLGSDVNLLFFEILPRLNNGVMVHIHDVFWPFEYPKAWIREGRAWNELYLLRAFLEFNSTFEVLFFADYLWKTNRAWFQSHAPKFSRNSGGNFWMRKLL